MLPSPTSAMEHIPILMRCSVFRRNDLLQPCIPGADDRFCSIRHLQLAENITQMVSHSFGAEEELCRRWQGCSSPALIRRKISRSRSVSVGKSSRRWRGVARRSMTSTRFATAGLKIASPLPTARMARTISSSSVSLRTYPRAPARKGREDRVVVLEQGHDEDTHRRDGSHDLADRVDAAHTRHLEVHQYDVGLQRQALFDRIRPGRQPRRRA